MEFKVEEEKIVLSLKAIETRANVDEKMQGVCISIEEPTIVQQLMAFSNVLNSKFVVNCPRLFSLATLPFKPGVSVRAT